MGTNKAQAARPEKKLGRFFLFPRSPGGWSFFFFLNQMSSLLLSSSTRRRFNPQRSSGQAVVTGVVPSSPRYVPPIFIAHRVQHSHCSSIFIECRQLTLSRFPLINFFNANKKSLRVCALGENWTREIDFSRHEDNLPSHRGRRLNCSTHNSCLCRV